MFVGASIKLSVALVLTLCCATSISALNMNNICLLVGDGYNIASEDSCSSYYSCSGGVAIAQSCGSSLYFSKDQQTCVSPSQVNCLLDNSAPCANSQIGTWAPMANSCSGFYYCGANGPQAGTCPNGENFDAVSQTCQYATVFGCSIAGGGSGSGDSVDGGGGAVVPVNLCSFIQNGVYFGSASSCAGWNTCSNNIMTSGACSNNLIFNVHLRTCDYASDWSCSQVTYDPSLTGSAGTTGGSCTQPGLIQNGTQCDSYYLCDGTQYQLTQCPTGLYFDTVSQTCVTRMQARNNCDRCEGTTRSFVNAYSAQNCTGYLYCVNGVRQSAGTCVSGYFDEIAGACVLNSTDPDYACCNPTWDVTTLSTEADSSTTVSASNSTAGGDNSTTTVSTTTVSTTSGSTTVSSTDSSSTASSTDTTTTTLDPSA